MYGVSSMGRVMSLNRTIRHTDGKVTTIKKRILKQNLNYKGYLVVFLSRSSKKKTVSVHRIIALAFLTTVEGKPQINHIDGNKKNNRVENLEWCNNSENQLHAYKHGLNRSRIIRGEQSASSKLKEYQILEIRKEYRCRGVSYQKLGEKYQVSLTTIGEIIRRVTWKHI